MFESQEKKEFRDFLRFCMGERIERLDQVIIATEKYQNLSGESDALYEQLKGALPEEQLNLLIRYSDKESDISSLEQFFFYEHGFWTQLGF